ncbi:RNA-directed DNA polymerase [Candidatus Saccharibacteria bacterium]|nr:RNA-directed DNA polymerase [Candidatus Saccharibacteria bacterium]
MKERVFYLDAEEARKYFLKSDSYFTMPMPKYYDFGVLLKKVARGMEGRHLEDYCVKDIRECEGVNYELAYSKDGGYGRRVFQLIHPVLYVELVNYLTKEASWERIKTRLRIYRKRNAVTSVSTIPWAMADDKETPAAILKWWHGMEQESIRLAMFFNYMAETDIMECYDSIGKRMVRRALGDMVGDRVWHLTEMMAGERLNGIPQGSMVYDFVAEVVLSYVDVLISNRLRAAGLKIGYTILRYRDDYRVFAKDIATVRKILAVMDEVMVECGMRLNPKKTVIHDDIIAAARKKDKDYWDIRRGLMRLGEYCLDNGSTRGEVSIQKWLLEIWRMSREHPNTGSVQRALVELYEKRIILLEHRPGDAYQIMSIVIDIMAHSPRTYQVGVAILCKIMTFNPGMSRRRLADLVLDKVQTTPSVDYLKIWLQRLTYRNRPSKRYECRLCDIAYDPSIRLWNSEWLNFNVRDQLVFRWDVARQMDFVMPVEEVHAFDGYDAEDEGDSCEDDDCDGDDCEDGFCGGGACGSGDVYDDGVCGEDLWECMIMR